MNASDRAVAPVDDLATTIAVEDAELDQELRGVKGRAVLATAGVFAAAAVGAITCAAIDLRLALLPAAFVLGWLNLAGL